ncbi:MAG: PAS domain S-box protein [Halofilum sp. (in: g-proteobacteria)]
MASMLDGMVLLDAAGRIVEFNPAAERTLGYARSQIIGKDFADTLLPEHLRDAHRRGLSDYRTSGQGDLVGRRLERPILRADGSEILVEQSITPADADAGDGPRFACQLRDLTAHKSGERQLHLRVAQQAAVAALGQEALANQDLQALLERAVRLVAEALDTALCQVLEFDGERWFELRAGVGWPEDLIGRTRTGSEGQAGYTLRVGEPVVVDDLRVETRFTPIPLLLAQGVISGMSAVICGPDDDPWGVLATHSRQRKQFTPEDAHFLQAVANTLATAIQRAKGEQYVLASEARERARADELNAIMESVPAVVWIAHDATSSVISGSRSSYEFLRIPAGQNQSQTASPNEAPTHFQMHIDGRPLSPHELPVQRAARGETVDGCELEARFTDGSRSFLFGNATPLYDEQGQPRGSVAAFVDITELKTAQQDRERLHARLEADRALMERILEQMPVGVIAVEAPSGKRLFRNPQVERLTGFATAPQQPHERHDFHARSDQGWPYTPDRWPLIRALRQGETITGEEMAFTHRDGRTRTISASASPIRDAAGHHIAAVTTFHDITERKLREEAASFLAEVTDLLGRSLDYEQTLARIAHLAVPRLGDWCIVDICESGIGEVPQSGIRRFAAHADPDKVAVAQRLAEQDILGAEASRGIGRVMSTGEAEWASEISDTMLCEAARDEEHLRALRELGLRSYICMPIKRREEVLGTITLLAAESGPREIGRDVQLAEELAERVGLALDNARLYQAARREVAERERAERELRQLNDELEQRVAARTAETEQRAAQLRALTAELAQTEQRERRRLAQILHDHLQQLLVAGKLEIANARRKVGDGASLQALERTHDLLDQSIQECRSLTVELSPPVLYDAGLIAGLRWLGQWMHEQHGLTVDLHADEGLDPEGDDLSVLLFQAVRELLFNAVKHAGVDRAEVRARRDATDQLEIRVRDRGRGFDPASAEADDTHDHFGLFSIRERAARLGGDLAVHSTPGRGTEVVLTVPDRSTSGTPAGAQAGVPPEAREAPDHKPVASDANRTGAIRVVLADDHEIVRAGLVSALQGQPDIDIVGEAGDGRTALEQVRRTRPSVAILDVTMPGMTGIEAARAITSEYPDVRVIGLSVHDSDDIAAAMRDAGAVEFVNKAAASDRLLAVIRGVAPPH